MKIKVLHLSSFDLSGGAARAAYRIHQGMQSLGINSQLIVQHKQSCDRTVVTAENKLYAKLRSMADSAPINLYPHRQQMFSPQWCPDGLRKKVDGFAPDILNLNWVCNGFVPVEAFAKFKQPLVWTLQDMWAFTGGCHYSLGCDRYQDSCGNCPQLKSDRDRDLSRWVWQRKLKAWQNLNLTIVTPSSWMAECARSSSLFQKLPIEVIPFGLDTEKFTPYEPEQARKKLNLPQDKHLVLFGAIDATGDTRKGSHLLQQALQQLSKSQWREQIELVIFGASRPEKPIDFGFPVHYLGHLNDDFSLRIAYSAANVMVAPSIEEAFGQTASESLACGTPVVVFDRTGLADIVDRQKNGYVANYGDTEDLARGIVWILENRKRQQKLRYYAREKAEQEFSLSLQASRYLSLFKEILEKEQKLTMKFSKLFG
jgi:glycosyltransferase involved in cell wall biosynthesis